MGYKVFGWINGDWCDVGTFPSKKKAEKYIEGEDPSKFQIVKEQETTEDEVFNNAKRAINKRFKCFDKNCPCTNLDYCKFGNGGTFNCYQCKADEFYNGYIQAIKDL